LLLLYKGDRVKVLGQKADWYEIELPSDIPLWVHKDYVVRGTGGAGEIRGSSVRVRHGAGTGFKVMGYTHTGRKIRVMGQQGDWLKFTYRPGDRGYVNIRYVVLAGRTEPRQPVKPPAHPVIAENNTGVLVIFKKAEDLYEKEVKKDNIADWDLTEAEKLYREAQAKTKDVVLKQTIAGRLTIIDLARKYQASLTAPDEYLKKLREREAEIIEEFRKKRQDILSRKIQPTYLATGRIEKLVSTWLKPATHKLMDGDKIVYLLYSDKLKLSVYEGYYAGILGEFDRSLKYDLPTVRVDEVDIIGKSEVTPPEGSQKK